MSSITDRANAWIVGGDTGLSSKTLWAVMMGQKPPRPSHPLDNGDLGRCTRLLNAVPEWRPRIKEMAGVSPYWAALVPRWDELEALDKTDPKACYKLMRALLDPVETKDPSVIRLGEGMIMRFGR